MAASAARVGRGTTLGYDLTSPFSTYTLCAEMVRVSPPEMDAGQVETTHLTSDDNAREFIPSGFIDYGSIEMTGNYVAAELDILRTQLEAQTVIGWKLTVPDKLNGTGTDTTWVFSGFIQKLKPFDEATVDGNSPLRHSMTIKVTGKITYTKATAGV